MPTKIELSVSVPVAKTARVLQLEGLFDVPPAERSARSWNVDVPSLTDEWQIGLVVGPSGSGKSTLAREAWRADLVHGYDWPADKSVIDGFPADLSIKDVTAALSSVGFSTPPAWLRPFGYLSNGEQFRATLARALSDQASLVVIDEFTSVVDRTVAQIGSAAVAKAVRRQPGKRFVAVTCHEDVAEWLCPDWIIEMPSGTLTRRSLRRPPIELEVRRVGTDAWPLFQHHHYLDTHLHPAAKCFVAFWRNRPVAFASVLSAPGRNGGWWREHRTVCLPDYQGLGIGNTLSELIAAAMRSTGKPYRSTTANPAMIRHRAKSKVWKMVRAASLVKQDGGRLASRRPGTRGTRATSRFTTGFEYVGPANQKAARAFGIG